MDTLTVTKPDAASQASGSAVRVRRLVSRRYPLPFFTHQWMQGWDAAALDYDKNTITDCPETEGTGAAQSWWDGYHAYEEERTKKEQLVRNV